MQLSSLQMSSLRDRWKDRITFAKEALGFEVAEHHKRIDDCLNTKDKILILLPPGHGKSHWCSYLYPLHTAIYNPNTRVLVLTKSGTRAVDFNKQTSDAIRFNPKLSIYSDLIPEDSTTRWNSSAITFNRSMNHKEPTLTYSGYGGQIEGLRVNIIDMDDVIDEEIARSAVESQNVQDRFERIIERRLEPDGKIVVVGTPFSPTDLYAYLEGRGDFHVLRLPAIKDDGSALWSWRFNLESLNKIHKSVPEHIWQQAYMMQAVTSTLCRFKWDWIAKNVVTELPSGLECVAGWDLAMSESKSADYTAGVVGMLDGKRLIIVDIFVDKLSSGQGEMAHRYATRWDVDRTYIETNTFQLYLKHEFDRLLPRKQAIGVENTKKKEIRLDGLEPYFRNGDIWHYKGIDERTFNIFKSEYTGYPLTKHNHVLDALQILVSNTIAHEVDSDGVLVVEHESLADDYKLSEDDSEYGLKRC